MYYKNNKIHIILLIVLGLILGFFIINLKLSMDVDEVFSYGLANHPYDGSISFEYPQNEVIEPAVKYWNSYMTVDPSHRFDFINVYKNQVIDTHPPLYYFLLHAVCSFFPGSFSLWYGGIVNILIYVISGCIVYFLCNQFTNNTVSFILSCGYICSAGTLTTITMFRMYCLCQLFVLLSAYILIRFSKHGINLQWTIYLIITSVLGLLSHYYFGIIIFCLFLLWGFQLFLERDFTQLIKAFSIGIISLIIYILVWPAFINHCILDGWGARSLSKAAGAVDEISTKESAILALKYINQLCAGSIAPLILVILLIMVMTRLFKQYRQSSNRIESHSPSHKHSVIGLNHHAILFFNQFKYLFITVLFYLTILSLINVRTDIERFLYPIFGLSYLSIMLLLEYQLSENKKKNTLLAGLIVIITILGYSKADFRYLYRNLNDGLQTVAQNQDDGYIFISSDDSFFPFWRQYEEVKYYKSAIFITEDEVTDFPNKEYLSLHSLGLGASHLCEESTYDIESILDQMPYANKYKLNNTYKMSESYILYGENLEINQVSIASASGKGYLSAKVNTPYSMSINPRLFTASP